MFSLEQDGNVMLDYDNVILVPSSPVLNAVQSQTFSPETYAAEVMIIVSLSNPGSVTVQCY